MDRLCALCLKTESDKTPWCKDNPGEGCTYGMHHEYKCILCDQWAVRGKAFCENHASGEKPVQQKKPDKKLCKKCGLHPKNPVSVTNGCEHDYDSAE